MIKVKFPKLYRYERKAEHCSVAIPFAPGVYTEKSALRLADHGRVLPVQSKVTSRHKDGSVRYLFTRFQADLPANAALELEAEVVSAETVSAEGFPAEARLCVTRTGGQIAIDGGKGGLKFAVSDQAETVLDYVEDGRQRYAAERFVGPFLEDGTGRRYRGVSGQWRIIEEGPLVAVLRCDGRCVPETGAAEGEAPSYELKLTAYAGKPWLELSCRLIDTTDEALEVAEYGFAVLAEGAVCDPSIVWESAGANADPTGEGKDRAARADICVTTGTAELPELERRFPAAGVRTCAASSNYKTNFQIGAGAPVQRTVDENKLIGEANEHFAEVFYGTFFADRTDAAGGVCATIYQAQQNYPKAVKADASGVYILLVPKGTEPVVMQSGMSREQRFLLHFHSAEEPLAALDDRSLIYQMPDKPSIPPEQFAAAGVMPDIFVARERMDDEIEIALIERCDGHTRSYGMMNFGDAPDPNYTKQGRGKGKLVWTNNEYDYPHACALFYARTGERRFQDYMIAAGSHWMDVDVCHYSKDPLLLGGQWEHTRGHCVDGVMVCSHEWVEGLLDYWHFTGDERALETALGIGENVRRLLETPAYQVSGESNARETGWALRTLTALYVETYEEKWLERAEWIVGHFREWREKYGGWIAPYTDNTLVRVGFMISVAVGSLMRYYRVFPSEELRTLILGAVDDLIENFRMENGLFYYKELPSLNRLGSNTLLLEAMTIGYELSGDPAYLKAGERTFWYAIRKGGSPAMVGEKQRIEDTVLVVSGPTKNFAQSFLPLSVYYKAATDAGVIGR